jgi:hypothetical protein
MLDGQERTSFGTTDHDRIVRIEEIVTAMKAKLEHLPCEHRAVDMAKLATAGEGREAKLGFLTWVFGLAMLVILSMLGTLLYHIAGTGK